MGCRYETREIGIVPSIGSFFWAGALGTTRIADPKEELMAPLMIQLRGAQMPNNSKLPFDLWTMM